MATIQNEVCNSIKNVILQQVKLYQFKGESITVKEATDNAMKDVTSILSLRLYKNTVLETVISKLFRIITIISTILLLIISLVLAHFGKPAYIVSFIGIICIIPYAITEALIGKILTSTNPQIELYSISLSVSNNVARIEGVTDGSDEYIMECIDKVFDEVVKLL